jgi:hypothetical protein
MAGRKPRHHEQSQVIHGRRASVDDPWHPFARANNNSVIDQILPDKREFKTCAVPAWAQLEYGGCEQTQATGVCLIILVAW